MGLFFLRNLRGLVVWPLFMSLQLGSASPFFGVSVQGGFRTEADISTSARAVGVVLDSTKHSMASFSARQPFNSASHNTAGVAVLQLYGILGSHVAAFTDRIAWAAANVTDSPSAIFDSLGVAHSQSVTALTETVVSATALVSSYSPDIGAQLSESWNTMVFILNDINSTLQTFQNAIGGFPTPVTAREIFERLTKFQIATIVGALDALTSEMTMASGKLQQVASTLMQADILMASYTTTLTQPFTNLDGSLTNLYNTLTRVSTEFNRQFRASESSVAAGVQSFNDKLATFTDDVIGAGADTIRTTTDSLSQTFTAVYNILQPNIDEQLQLLVDTALDNVLTVAQNQLFTTSRALDNVMRRIPTVPSKGRSCAVDNVSPYVQYLGSNMASALSGCISNTASQAEAVLRAQQTSIAALVKDRLAYVKLWNDALVGVNNNSDATTRRIAYAKLSAQTSNQMIDTLQPALASSFSMYAQLVSNLGAVLNRARLCVTLKGAELSAQLVSTTQNFNTCLQS